MPRLVDANKVAEAITWLDMLDFALWRDVQKCIDKLPTVDAVPVIRCKDCKCWSGEYCCDFMTSDRNGFCSWGERREDAEKRKESGQNA